MKGSGIQFPPNFISSRTTELEKLIMPSQIEKEVVVGSVVGRVEQIIGTWELLAQTRFGKKIIATIQVARKTSNLCETWA